MSEREENRPFCEGAGCRVCQGTGKVTVVDVDDIFGGTAPVGREKLMKRVRLAMQTLNADWTLLSNIEDVLRRDEEAMREAVAASSIGHGTVEQTVWWLPESARAKLIEALK